MSYFMLMSNIKSLKKQFAIIFFCLSWFTVSYFLTGKPFP